MDKHLGWPRGQAEHEHWSHRKGSWRSEQAAEAGARSQHVRSLRALEQ
jgi:hypothetical protein